MALLAGPGRWHIAGNAKVHTPWPLPDFSVHIDESWGTDRDTPQITVKVGEELAKEIGKRANWSAQLPQGGTGMVTLADINPGTDVLAHPLGTLLFQQKLVPFELRMAKASGSAIDGANEFGEGALQLSQSGQAVAGQLQRRPRTDFFAAAQFLEMSQDDKLAKPSFEAFTAGYELGDDNFELGETVPVDTELRGGGPRRRGAAGVCGSPRRSTARTSMARCWRTAPLDDRRCAIGVDAAAAAGADPRQPGAGDRGGEGLDDQDHRRQRAIERVARAPGARREHAGRGCQPGGRRTGGDRMSIPYRFSPWSRRGLARAHRNPDAAGGALATRPRISVGLTLQAKKDGTTTTAVSGNVDLTLYGPADIIGIDTRLIVRTEPKPGTSKLRAQLPGRDRLRSAGLSMAADARACRHEQSPAAVARARGRRSRHRACLCRH